MLRKKKKSAAPGAENGAGGTKPDSPIVSAPSNPQTASPTIEPPKPAGGISADSRPHSVSVASEAKAGPGRPKKHAHCLRCARRIERCKCKAGPLLAAAVAKAAEKIHTEAQPTISKDAAEQMLRIFLWALGVTESAIAGFVSGLTWSEAEECWNFTEEDVKALLPGASKILAKYAPKFPSILRDHLDEWMFCVALYNVHKEKYRAQCEMLAKKAAAEKQLPSAPKPLPEVPEENRGATFAGAGAIQ